MHQSPFFLRKLAENLQHKLKESKVSECFTQNKNELVIQFSSAKSAITIKAHLGASFCCLSFPPTIHRKKSNTTNIFKEVFALKVLNVGFFENERAFYIELQKDLCIVFQMFGSRSNVLLYKEGTLVNGFRKKHADVKHLNDFKFQKPHTIEPSYLNQNPALLGLPFKELIRRRIEEVGADLQHKMVEEMVKELNSAESFFLVRIQNKLHLSMIQTGEIREKFADPALAVTQFFQHYIKEDQLKLEKTKQLSQVKKQLVKTSNYLEKSKTKVVELKTKSNHKQIGDLIMANLQNIKLHDKSASLFNFYTNETIIIKLNPGLSAQKNAERYYRKAKNQSQEIQKLEENIASKTNLLAELEARIEFIENEKSVKSLRKSFKETVATKSKGPIPYNERVFKNFRILIGKSAKQNDTLLQKYSWKEDLWLHSKDGPGSHVLIKFQAGKNFPSDVIEHAAQLAAYYSKRKNDTLTPVIYTPRKFVRKRKGDPAGMVVVEKEKVILVEPLRET